MEKSIQEEAFMLVDASFLTLSYSPVIWDGKSFIEA